MHGANRLGGNGVANSTVFGGLAGAAMAHSLKEHGSLAEPSRAAVEAGLDRAFAPFGRAPGDLEAVREALYDTMWGDVGILRTGEGLARAESRLAALSSDIALCGLTGGDPRYNLTWMDRLNLENLIEVSKAICAAAQARTDSRGAHFREDFPETSDLASSRYTSVRQNAEGLDVYGRGRVHTDTTGREPARCSRVMQL